jgi:hypothetical protein
LMLGEEIKQWNGHVCIASYYSEESSCRVATPSNKEKVGQDAIHAITHILLAERLPR